MTPLPVLSAAGLTLFPLSPNEINRGYIGWLNDPRVTRYTEVSGLQTEQTVREYIVRELADSRSALWGISVKGRHIGNIRLSDIHLHHGRATIAILVGDVTEHGRGYGAAAIRIVTAHALGDLGLRKLTAGIYEPNLASRRAFEKAGFTLEARLTRHALFEGNPIDVLIYSVFRGSTQHRSVSPP